MFWCDSGRVGEKIGEGREDDFLREGVGRRGLGMRRKRVGLDVRNRNGEGYMIGK